MQRRLQRGLLDRGGDTERHAEREPERSHDPARRRGRHLRDAAESRGLYANAACTGLQSWRRPVHRLSRRQQVDVLGRRVSELRVVVRLQAGRQQRRTDECNRGERVVRAGQTGLLHGPASGERGRVLEPARDRPGRGTR